MLFSKMMFQRINIAIALYYVFLSICTSFHANKSGAIFFDSVFVWIMVTKFTPVKSLLACKLKDTI